MGRRLLIAAGLASLLLLTISCTSREYVIPDPYAGQVDTGITFSQLKESSVSYAGAMVVLGGEVLQAKRLREGTVIEILQLPMDGLEPVLEVQQSQGRFLAVHKEFLDPATLADRPRVTIVEEVIGARTQRLDHVDYTYPLVAVKHMKVWQESVPYGSRPGPRFGLSIGGGTGIGGGGLGIAF
jgi:outer membrane lipoprotein